MNLLELYLIREFQSYISEGTHTPSFSKVYSIFLQ